MGNTNFYLAGKFTRDEIVSFFYPNAANPAVFKYPKGHLFRLLGCVDAAGLSDPYFFDEQGNPCFTVAKDGQSTDLTFGRQSELEAYTYVAPRYNERQDSALFIWYSANFVTAGQDLM